MIVYQRQKMSKEVYGYKFSTVLQYNLKKRKTTIFKVTPLNHFLCLKNAFLT